MKQPQTPPSAPTPRPAPSLLGQAEQWLTKGSMPEMLGQLSPALKNTGGQMASRFNKLSTTQKVVGGVLLFLGVRYLVRRDRKHKGHGRKHKGNKHGDYKEHDPKGHGHNQADTLNELLYFVNDRIEGYQRAVEESKDAQLSGYYKQLVSQSQQFANQLNDYLRQQGGERQTGTTLKGKLYRGWMDAKAALTGRDEKAILGSNIYGEEWALKAYKDALDDGSLAGAMRQTVEHQYELSQKTYRELQNKEAKQ